MRKLDPWSWWFKGGAALAVFAAEKMELPTFVTGLIALFAVAYFSVGFWFWVGQFQHQHYSVRAKENLKLKLLVTGLFIGVCVVSFIYYHQLIPISTSEQDRLIERYRNLFKISEIPNKTTLIELTDKELKAKGTLLYKKIKDMNAFYAKNIRKLQTQLDAQQISKEKFIELNREQAQKGAEEFDKESRVDAQMVLLELRNRIPYERRKHIVGLPSIKPADPRDGSVSLYSIMTGEFGFWWSETLAREIEELVKLLPD